MVALGQPLAQRVGKDKLPVLAIVFQGREGCGAQHLQDGKRPV